MKAQQKKFVRNFVNIIHHAFFIFSNDYQFKIKKTIN